MYGDEPDQWRDDLQGMARLRFITNCLTRLRVCTADGRLKLKEKTPLAELKPGLLPWFRLPQRRSRNERIVFGHWSALGFYDHDNVLGLDTGCVWGGALSAMRLDRPAPLIQVKSISGGLPLED
jgi:bis(5'-nucleosyl)-tetraphosphatase (symmetrical)